MNCVFRVPKSLEVESCCLVVAFSSLIEVCDAIEVDAPLKYVVDASFVAVLWQWEGELMSLLDVELEAQLDLEQVPKYRQPFHRTCLGEMHLSAIIAGKFCWDLGR